MKVLSVTTVFPNAAQPTHGAFVYQRLRHMVKHAEVRVMAPVSWRARSEKVKRIETRGGLQVHHPTFFYVPGVLKVLDGLALFLSMVRATSHLRRTFDYDLIDAHFAFPDGFAAALLAAWTRRPFTITMRGTEIPISRYRLRKWAMAWALRRADGVIAVAQPLADYALALGVAPDRVAVIDNGVDTELFQPARRDEAREAIGVDAAATLIVSVGHLSARKGFQRVIRVLPALLRARPNIMFAVVGGPGGEPSNEAALKALVNTLGLETHVIFAGPQSAERVADWLTAADVFVLASDYEGCPNVVLEALACGRPVVATRVGHVEFMVPAHGGVLFDDPEDAEALTHALEQALHTIWDTARIRAHAERQSWWTVADRVAERWQLAAARGHAVSAPPASHQPMGIRLP